MQGRITGIYGLPQSRRPARGTRLPKDEVRVEDLADQFRGGVFQEVQDPRRPFA